jgi:hypothetical protein
MKRSGVRLQEGDTVIVKGFPGAGMERDLIVATEIPRGDKHIPPAGHARPTDPVATQLLGMAWIFAESVAGDFHASVPSFRHKPTYQFNRRPD